MSAIRLYLDEDATQHALLAALRLRGIDVTSALEVGMIGVFDEPQLEWCCSESRVLYTFNVGHFHALHTAYLKSGRTHPGIVIAPQQRYSIGGQLRRLIRLTAARTAESMRDRVEFLSNWT